MWFMVEFMAFFFRVRVVALFWVIFCSRVWLLFIVLFLCGDLVDFCGCYVLCFNGFSLGFIVGFF